MGQVNHLQWHRRARVTEHWWSDPAVIMAVFVTAAVVLLVCVTFAGLVYIEENDLVRQALRSDGAHTNMQHGLEELE